MVTPPYRSRRVFHHHYFEIDSLPIKRGPITCEDPAGNIATSLDSEIRYSLSLPSPTVRLIPTAGYSLHTISWMTTQSAVEFCQRHNVTSYGNQHCGL